MAITDAGFLFTRIMYLILEDGYIFTPFAE